MLPTVGQMKNRMLSGHAKALRAIAAGESPYSDHPAARNDNKGMRTVIATLERWGLVESTYVLTERGRTVLDQLLAR